jgi:hypothetical protein
LAAKGTEDESLFQLKLNMGSGKVLIHTLLCHLQIIQEAETHKGFEIKIPSALIFYKYINTFQTAILVVFYNSNPLPREIVVLSKELNYLPQEKILFLHTAVLSCLKI